MTRIQIQLTIDGRLKQIIHTYGNHRLVISLLIRILEYILIILQHSMKIYERLTIYHMDLSHRTMIIMVLFLDLLSMVQTTQMKI
jgi:hypothetical protein